jgi:hypothetical protein
LIIRRRLDKSKNKIYTWKTLQELKPYTEKIGQSVGCLRMTCTLGEVYLCRVSLS